MYSAEFRRSLRLVAERSISIMLLSPCSYMSLIRTIIASCWIASVSSASASSASVCEISFSFAMICSLSAEILSCMMTSSASSSVTYAFRSLLREASLFWLAVRSDTRPERASLSAVAASISRCFSSISALVYVTAETGVVSLSGTYAQTIAVVSTIAMLFAMIFFFAIFSDCQTLRYLRTVI